MSYQTPGVYTIEKSAFPNAVVEVATAIPVFIGYTQRAVFGGKDLTNVPTKVESLKEFEDFFGRNFNQVFTLTSPAQAAGDQQPAADTLAVLPPSLIFPDKAGTSFSLQPAGSDAPFYLYNAMRLFYLNGGSTCFVVSVGGYIDKADATKATTAAFDDFDKAIASLVYEQMPTMLVCPDALRLSEAEYYKVVTQMLAHCEDVQSRVAIFDVYRGAMTKSEGLATTPNAISVFRDSVGQNYLKYGVAYFPWVNTSVTSDSDITFLNLDEASLTLLRDALNPVQAAGADQAFTEVQVPILPGFTADQAATAAAAAKTAAQPAVDAAATKVAKAKLDAATTNGALKQNIFDQAIALLKKDAMPTAELLAAKRTSINNSLRALYPSYVMTLKALAHYLNTLPVASAMAGVYTAVDNGRGVWKAPANVSLNAVVSPTLSLSDKNQESLNVDAVSGKSINAIRSFKGLGVMVWGARTLDGNSQDWKYVNVRRTMIFIEQSVKLAARAYVFDPNDANTWVTIKSMISSFLFNLWKEGALFGASPAEAYSVSVGLGSTMTAADILNGYMNVTVLVALVRPAEFILLTFQQQMGES